MAIFGDNRCLLYMDNNMTINSAQPTVLNIASLSSGLVQERVFQSLCTDCWYQCVPIRDDRCSLVLPYPHTTFPTPLGLPDQDLALAVTPGVFTALDLVSRCPHLDTFLCSLIYPQCTPEKIRMPCRSFCRDVIRTCAGPVLGEMQDWLTLFCDALPDRNCTRPAPCEPIQHATCGSHLPYNTTGFPNMLGHGSQAELLADPVTLNDTAQLIDTGCHPEIGFAIPPCKSFCREVREACEPTMVSMGQVWPFDCDSFPDAHQGKCSSPYNETARALTENLNQTGCEPIRFPRCSASALPYRSARFPSALGLPDQGLVLAVAPVVFTAMDLLKLSECSPHLDTVLCALMYQDCRTDELRLPCASMCRDIISSCAEPVLKMVGIDWIPVPALLPAVNFVCNMLPEEGCIQPGIDWLPVPALLPAVNFVCNMLPEEGCIQPGMGGMEKHHNTTTRTFCGRVQDAVRDFPRESAGRPPGECDTFCGRVRYVQRESAVRSAGECGTSSGRVRYVLRESAVRPAGECDTFCGRVRYVQRETCEPLQFDRCSALPYSHTSFPNFFGLADQQTALVIAPAVFAGLDLLMLTGCHPQLDIFFCALSFPGCTPEGTKLPCRSFCEELMFTCGGPLLAAVGMDWVAFGCYLLPDDNCVAAAPHNNTADVPRNNNTACEPIQFDRCMGMPYSHARFPGIFGLPGNDLALTLAPVMFAGLDEIPGDHPYLEFAVCSMLFPQCTADEGIRLPCQSFCEAVLESYLGPVLGEMTDLVKMVCFPLPDRDCVGPAPSEPIEVDQCKNILPYNTTLLPDLMGHVSQAAFLGDSDTLGALQQVLDSGCLPEVGLAVCSLLLPNAMGPIKVPVCKSFCRRVKAHCGATIASLGLDLPLDCENLPDILCTSPHNNTANSTECEPVRFARCSALSHAHTRFPSPIGLPSQDFALVGAPAVFAALDTIHLSDCHPHLDTFVCSLIFPGCKNRLPCRSLCQDIVTTCGRGVVAMVMDMIDMELGDMILDVGLQMTSLVCNQLPEEDCMAASPAPSNKTGAHAKNNTECSPEPVRYGRCGVLLHSQTSFPNAMFLPSQDFALSVVPAMFGAMDLLMPAPCHPHLDIMVCSMFFQECSPEGVRLPCRSLCEEVLSACGGAELAQVGLEWIMLACYALPETDCISPEFECEPIYYDRCGALPYPHAMFPNILGLPSQDFSMSVTSSIYTGMDLLELSDCHPQLEDVVCSLFFPNCTKGDFKKDTRLSLTPKDRPRVACTTARPIGPKPIGLGSCRAGLCVRRSSHPVEVLSWDYWGWNRPR
ncbi:hypothetical protein Bbelb_321560 [Branchiostoma belcheri]|nr:hypothetical protein Bbelb_321560 [Branchiostoma belcheri]